MVDLDFTVQDARFDPASLAPLMLFALHLTNRTPHLRVQNVSLQCQVRIEPARRRYDGAEPERLMDLFGEPARWAQTLTSFLWAQASVSVPSFDVECRTDLPVPCSLDFTIAATKYFHALTDGAAPLSFLFSGTVFYRDEDARLQIAQIPWTKEASYRLPVATWAAMMDHHHPDHIWLPLDRDVFERLYAYKRRMQLPRWEDAIDTLIAAQSTEPVQ